jgi:cation diffusion facilitator family transporter
MKNRNEHGDFHEFVLLILLKEGELGLKGLEDKTSLFISHFSLSAVHFVEKLFEKMPWPFRKLDLFRKERFDKRHKYNKIFDSLKCQCEELIREGYVRKNKDNEYELTEKGKYKAAEFKKNLEKGAYVFESQFRRPEAATRNTFIVNIFLTVIKLTTGFLSGSVGLLADGADACIDTFSAAAVWLGMKFKKELVGVAIITIMMFVTGISVGAESVSKLVQIFRGAIEPIVHPLLVILVESVAMIFALGLTFYQRYVGKSYGNFTLISQSVDSKNHIFVAAAVIVGTILSIFGLHFMDAFVGVYISYRILKDTYTLAKEAFLTIKGGEVDIHKYKVPFEEQWHLSKLESFRLWVLYAIRENKITTREKIIENLRGTFDPEYLPVMSEFKFALGKGFDFEGKFDTIIQPLLEKELIVEEQGVFSMTKAGEKHLDKKFHIIRFHEHK